MSLTGVNSDSLPAIPTPVRQWTYLLFLVLLLVLQGIDVFWETGDPWWLPGGLRVADLVQLFIMGVVLAHTRPTATEQRVAAVKEQRKLDQDQARYPLVADDFPPAAEHYRPTVDKTE